jgi:DNA-binding NarL/FixJ family response regulator
MDKKKVLLIMHRKMLSDVLIEQAKNDLCFELRVDQNYALAVSTATSYTPGVVVVEIPESGSFRSAEKCLSICDAIRKQVPGCKRVLLCSESDADSCRAAIQAKMENRIDDFLYYDTSVNYLFSKLESLTQ